MTAPTPEFRLVTADDLCDAAGAALTAYLPPLLTALGLDVDQPGRPKFKVPANWTQVPTVEALQSAAMPAGAITSNGIVGQPRRSTLGVAATWRIRVAVFDRGGDYNATANRVRTWAALVRALEQRNPTLGGIASAVRWAGESYRNIGQASAARTLGGCVVEFDVDARNVMDLAALAPAVLSTGSTVTVR